MIKRWTAALLAFVLAAALLPTPVRAAAAADSSAGSRLTGVNREIYEYLKDEIIEIAKGNKTNTEVKLPDMSSLSWPVSELGASNSQADILGKLKEKLAQALDMDLVYRCLAADLPYEMFWMDNRYSWGCSLSRAGNTASVKNVTVRLYVSPDYRSGGETTASRSKIAAAVQAAESAQDIVDRYQNLPDMEKLAAYREEICRLVSYNTGAARGGAAYGDPWQLVYVFDGDPGTNVVCEGYAKAFKYLCDLSEFEGNVMCRIVTGLMGTGSHMWNVVQMGDGKNYLVDVTNCDSGAIGADDKLFLTGAAGSVNGSYTVSKGFCRAVYTYDEEMGEIYAESWLVLNSTDYVPGFDLPVPESAALTAAAFADVAPEAYYAAPVAWAVEEAITVGTSETTFSPDEPCTHGQILTFLWRAAGEPSSSGRAPDGVKQGTYYYDALCWAFEKGMLSGTFDSEAGCSRADAVRYIWLAFDGPSSQVASFTDVPSDAPYAPAVGWAVLEGVTTGTSDDTFSPDGICSRGEIVTFLYRAYH